MHEEKAERASGVAMAMLTLESELEELSKAIEEVSIKLTSVLMSENPQRQAEDEPKDYSCDLVRWIQAQRKRLAVATERLTDLQGRIDL